MSQETTFTVPSAGVELVAHRRGSGPILVLVHGSASDVTTWDGVIDALAKTHDVITYDRRGYGHSTHEPIADHRIHSADLEAVILSLDAGPVDVVGWSSGGVIALDLAGRRPDLIRDLIVMEAPVHGFRNTTRSVFLGSMATQRLHAAGKDREAMVRFLQSVSRNKEGGNSFDGAPDEIKAGLLGYTPVVIKELTMIRFGPLGEWVDYKAIAKSGIPITWLVGGESARWFNRIAERAARTIPSIRIEHVVGGSHLMHHEQPDRFVNSVECGLRRTRSEVGA